MTIKRVADNSVYEHCCRWCSIMDVYGHGGAGQLSIHEVECAPPTLALERALVNMGKRGRVFMLLWKLRC